jgi:hypothetical protein
MAEPQADDDQFDDEDVEQVGVEPPLMLARAYLTNARRIGEPGSPNMIEAAALQHQHAEMASAAALVSVAESLHRLARDGHHQHRRFMVLVSSVDTMAKELTKLRYLARGGR